MPRRGGRRGGGQRRLEGRDDHGGGRGSGGGRRGLQQVYGWFRCKQCNRHWESSHVYRVIGTLIVPYRQACRKCAVKVFTGPYHTECIDCGEKYCECYFDDCDDNDDYYSDQDSADDGRKRDRHNDDKKPHERSLCEKCQTGRPCR